jgi:hypothetical protein
MCPWIDIADRKVGQQYHRRRAARGPVAIPSAEKSSSSRTRLHRRKGVLVVENRRGARKVVFPSDLAWPPGETSGSEFAGSVREPSTSFLRRLFTCAHNGRWRNFT